MLLTMEQEKKVFLHINQKNQVAKDEFILRNIPLVIAVAKKYVDRGMELEDLVQEGIIGMIKAVDRFNVDLDCKFSTYATWWIRQGILRAIDNQARLIRLPVCAMVRARLIQATFCILWAELERDPMDQEIAKEIGLDSDIVNFYHIANKKIFSLDSPLSDDTNDSYTDILIDPENLENNIIENNFCEKVRNLIETLPEINREVLKRRFGIGNNKPETLAAIGKDYDLSRERIRQIEKDSFKKCKIGSRGEKIKKLQDEILN